MKSARRYNAALQFLILSYGLNFFVISVNYVISVKSFRSRSCFWCRSSLWSCLTSLWSCLTSLCACLFVNLCEQFLSAFHQFFFSCFDFCNLSICKFFCIRFRKQIFQSLYVSFYCCFVCCINLISNFAKCFFCLEYHSVGIVLSIDCFFTFLILSFKFCSFFYSFVDICIRHIRSCCNCDVLFFSCSQIFCRYIYDTVCINIECNFDLWDSTWSRRNSIQSELSEGLVISCKLSFTLYNIDINGCLVISCCREDLALLCRDCCVSLDQSCSYTTHCFDRK